MTEPRNQKDEAAISLMTAKKSEPVSSISLMEATISAFSLPVDSMEFGMSMSGSTTPDGNPGLVAECSYNKVTAMFSKLKTRLTFQINP